MVARGVVDDEVERAVGERVRVDVVLQVGQSSVLRRRGGGRLELGEVLETHGAGDHATVDQVTFDPTVSGVEHQGPLEPAAALLAVEPQPQDRPTRHRSTWRLM